MIPFVPPSPGQSTPSGQIITNSRHHKPSKVLIELGLGGFVSISSVRTERIGRRHERRRQAGGLAVSEDSSGIDVVVHEFRMGLIPRGALGMDMNRNLNLAWPHVHQCPHSVPA